MELKHVKNNVDNNLQLQIIIKNNAKKIIINKDGLFLKAGEAIKYVYYLKGGRAKIVRYCEDSSIQILKQ